MIDMALLAGFLFYGMPVLVWLVGFGYLVKQRDFDPQSFVLVAIAGALWVLFVPYWLYSYLKERRRQRTNNAT